MVKKIYYEKVGRKYVPVAEYDSDYLDAFPKGTTLVICHPGGQSRRYNIDPDYAALIAAARVAEDAMLQAMQKASELKPQQTPVTPAQQQAWKKLAREFGDSLCTLNSASSYDITQAGLKALEDEAAKLLTNAAVKEAYDQFLFVCALTKQQRK
jgi:ABC-type branched-subunit amino acid transport system substrate-binding protein